MTLIERAEAIVKEAHRIADATMLEAMVQDLAQLVRDHVAATVAAPPPPKLEEGREYHLLLRVRATVAEAPEEGGYVLHLEQRDYMLVAHRRVCVDANEVVGVQEVAP